jgi:hypothetical protein
MHIIGTTVEEVGERGVVFAGKETQRHTGSIVDNWN